MISSHFSSLKNFAFTSKEVSNSMMLFDEENLKPTYKFNLGIPGRSYGIEVASRYGVNSKSI
jgi:DNA mismatch repair protein MutS2